MTNTQIMGLLRNIAINKDTKKVMLIAAGLIVVGGIAVYYYSKNQQNAIASLNTRHTNYVNFSESKINDLDITVNQKVGLLAEQEGVIKQLQEENIILQDINKKQLVKA
jgi:uncharacterized membrane protein SpoIIM required for sporulation